LCPWVPAGRITSNPLLTRAYARSRFARAVQHSTAVADGCAARRLLYARPVPSAGVLFRHPGCRRSRGHAHRRAGTTPPTGYAATWRSTPRSSRRRCSPTPLRRASPSARCTGRATIWVYAGSVFAAFEVRRTPGCDVMTSPRFVRWARPGRRRRATLGRGWARRRFGGVSARSDRRRHLWDSRSGRLEHLPVPADHRHRVHRLGIHVRSQLDRGAPLDRRRQQHFVEPVLDYAPGAPGHGAGHCTWPGSHTTIPSAAAPNQHRCKTLPRKMFARRSTSP
jgi:hypothetical protein